MEKRTQLMATSIAFATAGILGYIIYSYFRNRTKKDEEVAKQNLEEIDAVQHKIEQMQSNLQQRNEVHDVSQGKFEDELNYGVYLKPNQEEQQVDFHFQTHPQLQKTQTSHEQLQEQSQQQSINPVQEQSQPLPQEIQETPLQEDDYLAKQEEELRQLQKTESIREQAELLHFPDWNQHEKKLYILRGLPGSGKSTLAKELIQQEGGMGRILSTDDYFVRDGTYQFDPSEIPQAHRWNQQQAMDCFELGITPVIVDNTNTQKWEARPYVENALDHGYTVLVREPNTPWKWDVKTLARNNVHGVSEAMLKKMKDRWEDDFEVGSILVAEMPKTKRTKRKGDLL